MCNAGDVRFDLARTLNVHCMQAQLACRPLLDLLLDYTPCLNVLETVRQCYMRHLPAKQLLPNTWRWRCDTVS